MADEDAEEPAIALGEGAPVEGAPVARVAERLMWGIEKSAIESREGDAVIRTPDGPRELGSVLEEVDRTYFATRQEFLTAVEGVIGRGPVPTADDEGGEPAEEDESGDDADGENGAESVDGEDEGDEDEAGKDDAGDTSSEK